MKFDICTIFPNIFSSYIEESIIKRAIQDKKISVNVHNIRDYAHGKHKQVDDSPYSGGAGMLMKIEPIFNTVVDILDGSKKIQKSGITHSKESRVILMGAKGEIFNQKKAKQLSKYNQIVLICGRYEGVDERVVEYVADEEISIGEYILTGGEVPSLVILDSVARLKEGVLGNKESLRHESFNTNKKEYPQYTRPASFSPKKGVEWKVPDVLYSGDHKKIQDWKEDKSA